MSKLTIEFGNDRVREHFAQWLSGSGEQEYWKWMKYREAEQDGPITALRFDYFIGGKFNSEYIKTECGRLDDNEKSVEIE